MNNQMKKTLLGLTTAAIMSFTVAVNAAPIKLKFSHVVAENTPKGQMATKFKELVAERLAGKVEVEIYPNGQLFGDNKVLEALLLGDVQIAAPSLSKFKKYTKKLQIFDLPFLFNDMAAAERFQSGDAGQSLLKSVEPKGLIGLGYMHNGMKQMSASKELHVPADAKGLKFRIMSSDVLSAQFKAVGATPLKKPYSEVFTLLQTKAIDGQENTWSNIHSKKFYEVQDHITSSDHGLLDYMVVTSAEFWNGLDADLRSEIKKALDEAVVLGNKVAAEKSLSDKQAIIDSNRTNVIELTKEERQQWADAMKPVWQEFEEIVGADLLAAAIAANKE